MEITIDLAGRHSRILLQNLSRYWLSQFLYRRHSLVTRTACLNSLLGLLQAVSLFT